MVETDWLTIRETMNQLNVSRQYVYTLARRYGWQTEKRGNMRYFCAADVASTPDADERRKLGYENRVSTRVEK